MADDKTYEPAAAYRLALMTIKGADTRPRPPLIHDRVTVVRRVADPARRRRIIRLLAELLHKPSDADAK